MNRSRRPSALLMLLAVNTVAFAAAVAVVVSRVPTASELTQVVSEPAVVATSDPFKATIQPLLRRYCFDCHGEVKQKADLNLTRFADAKAVQRGRQTWLKAWQMLHTREMPPEDAPQPTADERTLLADWIEGTVNDINCDGAKDPGRVVLRRLTRYEYRHTIRDLAGVDFYPAADFPADNIGYGFDNIGDVLTLPPLLMERYLTAAETIIDEAVVTDADMNPPKQHLPAEGMAATVGTHAEGGERMLLSNGELHTPVTLPANGRYRLRVKAWGQRAGGEPPRMVVKLGEREALGVEVKATRKKPKTYEVEVDGAAGEHKLSVAFTNDYWNPDAADADDRDRNLVVLWAQVVGPLEDNHGELPESHRLIFGAGGSTPPSKREAAKVVLARFASRAFRRPVEDAEVERLLTLFDAAASEGQGFEAAMKLPLTAVLVSPHFLFRVEGDGEGTGDGTQASVSASVVPLNGHELATRLSYFLWSTMPDGELTALATGGKLADEAVLRGQVRRMLADPRAVALADNFAVQWLQLRRLDSVTPDSARFPSFTPELRNAMLREAVGLFDHIRREDRSLLELLDADYTFVNEPLAKHYGIPGVVGPEVRRVDLPDRHRGGVMTLGAVLTVTSNPTRTNPTRRGKWVLETILGTPPPPPAPDVGELEDVDSGGQKLTVRQLLELHRSDPNCAGCHARMDPIGFAFERFDPVGAWRTSEEGGPIDDSASLPDGRTFTGPGEFKKVLLDRRDDFSRALAERMLTYALGRGLEYYDVCAIKEITRPLGEEGYRLSALVTEIALSYPFRHRRTADFKEPE